MHAKSLQHASNELGVVTGWINSWPNPYSANVKINLDMLDEQIEVHMPWTDRFDGFSSFLQRCNSVFRISAVVHGRHIQGYTLWVHTGNLNLQMETRGCIDGEVHALAALKHFSLQSHLPPDIQTYKVDLPDTDSNVDHFNNAYSLFASQKESLRWMRGVEEAISMATNLVQYNACIPVSAIWHYDIMLDCFRQKTAVLKTRFRGGCLCDGVGTGKTVVALALAAQRQRPELDLPGDLLVSTGTLVLVPVNIPLQWSQEASKFFPALRVVVLSSMRDVRAHTIREILTADIVITTPNLLRNRAYLDQMEELVKATLHDPDIDRRDGSWHRSLRSCSRSVKRCSRTDLPPFVELIMFKRLIVDEMHEYVVQNTSGREKMRVLMALKARITWGLTATPDNTCEGLQHLYPLLLEPKVCDESFNYHPCLMSAVKHDLLRCHSNERGETTCKLKFVNLSAFERACIAEEPLVPFAAAVQLCSCPIDQSNEKEALNQWLEERQYVVTKAEEEIVKLENAILRCATRVNRNDHSTPAELNHLTMNLSAAEDRFIAMSRAHAYSLTRLKNIETCEECCPVCLDAAPRSMLNCGHVLCVLCSRKLSSRECPVCRMPFEKLYTVSCEGRHGSKALDCALLITTLVSQNEQIIAFSQWKPLATSVLEGLNGVKEAKAAILEGPTARRTSLIKKFQDRSINILIILLDKSYAGLNLVEATSVVFLHAITGTAADAIAMEEQAIGRAVRPGQPSHVSVYHVLAKDSPEEVLWRQRHPEQN